MSCCRPARRRPSSRTPSGPARATSAGAPPAGPSCWRSSRATTSSSRTFPGGFRGLRDFSLAFESFRRRGGVLHVADGRVGVLDPEDEVASRVVATLRAFADLHRVHTRAHRLESNRRSVGQSRRNARQARVLASFGWRTRRVRREDGSWRTEYERDDAERAVMARIVAMRDHDPPWAWPQIVRTLAAEGVLTRNQLPWSLMRARRADRHERALAAAEARLGRPLTGDDFREIRLPSITRSQHEKK